jgi:hypothetical protein
LRTDNNQQLQSDNSENHTGNDTFSNSLLTATEAATTARAVANSYEDGEKGDSDTEQSLNSWYGDAIIDYQEQIDDEESTISSDHNDGDDDDETNNNDLDVEENEESSEEGDNEQSAGSSDDNGEQHENSENGMDNRENEDVIDKELEKCILRIISSKVKYGWSQEETLSQLQSLYELTKNDQIPHKTWPMVMRFLKKIGYENPKHFKVCCGADHVILIKDDQCPNCGTPKDRCADYFVLGINLKSIFLSVNRITPCPLEGERSLVK